MVKYQEVKDGIIFPRGSKNDAYAAVFTGQSTWKRWLQHQMAESMLEM